MADASLLLQEREKCEKNLYFKEWIKRIYDELKLARETVAGGVKMGFPMIKFYQGQNAAFKRVLLIPDEIIEDASKEETTGEPS